MDNSSFFEGLRIAAYNAQEVEIEEVLGELLKGEVLVLFEMGGDVGHAECIYFKEGEVFFSGVRGNFHDLCRRIYCDERNVLVVLRNNSVEWSQYD